MYTMPSASANKICRLSTIQTILNANTVPQPVLWSSRCVFSPMSHPRATVKLFIEGKFPRAHNGRLGKVNLNFTFESGKELMKVI